MNLPPKKSLGQNFLRSKKILGDIIEAGQIEPNDLILEIGPGKGILTEALLKVAREVTAVEKDDRLILHLNLKFKNEIAAGKLKIIHRDILEFNPEEVAYQKGGYKIVANIPYYITGIFLRRFLSGEIHPNLMVLMVQREVGKRIVAKDGKESLLSLSVKSRGEPEYIETVKAENFSPPPKVDSAIIAIRNITDDFFTDLNEEKFFEIIGAAFRGKRKMIRKSLADKFGPKILEIIREAKIPEISRPEDLTLADWNRLTKLISRL